VAAYMANKVVYIN